MGTALGDIETLNQEKNALSLSDDQKWLAGGLLVGIIGAVFIMAKSIDW